MSTLRASRADFLPDNRSRLRHAPRRRWVQSPEHRINRGPGSDEARIREIRRLPSLASDFYEGLDPFTWSPVLREMLQGTRDAQSPFHSFQGFEDSCVRHIYSFLASEWANHVTLTIPASDVGMRLPPEVTRFNFGRHFPHFTDARERFTNGLPTLSSGQQGFVAFASCGRVEFPEPNDRNVNMLPFKLGDKASLPYELREYHELIEKCPYLKDEVGKVGYLTVHESYVEASQAQRREGLHIESPGFFSDDPNSAAFSPAREHPWGMGMFFGPDRFEGGIYMASTVADTSKVWDALVDKNVKGIVDTHGGCDHLKRMIGPGTNLEANELIWMTDCTPHQALPQQTAGYRQFFRVVMPYISHWYADHSTPNPLVAIPDDVTIIHGNKFA